MERIQIKPRANWQQRVEKIGLTFHTANGVPYWNEAAYYRFTRSEVDTLEAATNTLQELYVQAAQHVIDANLFDRLAIPHAFRDLIVESWDRDDPSLYGRFDLCFDGRTAPKLLEYNADTPTSLIEASVAQWYWLGDVLPGRDQFNSIHEKLVEAWKFIGAGRPMYFSCIRDEDEDRATVEYLMDTALQAGLSARFIHMEDIGWRKPHFYDLEERAMEDWFKLYPWEWMIHEDFGKYLLLRPVRAIEPPWKMLWSNKGLLPILWELFPDHPNLLPAFDSPESLGERYAAKPLLSREGANVTLRAGSEQIETGGEYGEEGFVYQALAELPVFDGNHAVIGSWIVGGEAAGIGVREDDTPVTGNLSRFVPHYFE